MVLHYTLNNRTASLG